MALFGHLGTPRCSGSALCETLRNARETCANCLRICVADPLHLGVWDVGGAGQVRGPETACNIEVRDRPKLVRAVVWMDQGFEMTCVESLTCLVGPVTVDFGTF